MISIVVPNYNGEKLLQKNLPKLIQAAKYDKNIGEIIVVDDCSKDNSLRVIDNFADNLRVIKHKINRGFPASVNTGIRASRNDFVALLNTDVTPQKDFLKSALKLINNPQVFAVSFHEKGYGPARGEFNNGYVIHSPIKESGDPINTFWASGGTALFKRKVLITLGGMDEKLYSPYYWEDIDLSYRAQKRGYKVIWDPNSHVIHEHEATMGNISNRLRSRIQERNQLLFIWKNITSKSLIKKHLTGLLKRIIKHPGYLLVVIMAFTKVRLCLRARRKEYKECKVSDEAIFAKFI